MDSASDSLVSPSTQALRFNNDKESSTGCASGHQAALEAQEEKRLQSSSDFEEITETTASLEKVGLGTKQLGGADDTDSAEVRLKTKPRRSLVRASESEAPREQNLNRSWVLDHPKDHIVEPKHPRPMKKELGTDDSGSAQDRPKRYKSTSNLSLAKVSNWFNVRHRPGLQSNRILDDFVYPTELKGNPSPSGPLRMDKSSQIHAVIVGINVYESYPLRGCVSDARLMEKYLIEVLGVPNNHIRLLLGSEEHTSPNDQMNPSRANIIGALLGLTTNPKIKDGDPIIIYFAGHGSSYSPLEDDDAYGSIEALCPIDRDTVVDGEAIPDISDREFNTILSLISREKGHRITVILDCCHGVGVSRDLPGPGVRTSPQTTHATLQDMLLAGEKNLKDYPGYHSILSKNWYPDMDSHVILTACKEYQFAKEKKVEGKDSGHIGVFTDKLVRVLRSDYITDNTTYVNLISVLGTSVYQTPGVYGKRKGTRIWYQD